jgi:hypothetical protein
MRSELDDYDGMKASLTALGKAFESASGGDACVLSWHGSDIYRFRPS